MKKSRKSQVTSHKSSRTKVFDFLRNRQVTSYKLGFTPPGTGFTLVEMMIAVAIFVIIIGALFALLLGGQRSWQTQEAYVQVGQEARRALGRMTRQLRGADITNTNWPTDSVTFSLDGIDGTYEIDTIFPDRNGDGLTNQIVYFDDSGKTNIVANFIGGLTLDMTGDNLSIEITASRETPRGDGVTNIISETITLRN